MKELPYMKGCTLCEEGMKERIDSLVDSESITVNKAAGFVAQEIEDSFGFPLYSQQSIRCRHDRLSGKVAQNEQQPSTGARDTARKTPKSDAVKELEMEQEPADTELLPEEWHELYDKMLYVMKGLREKEYTDDVVKALKQDISSLWTMI